MVREGAFFGVAAMVTFGGAYAVLPYVAQQAVVQRRSAARRPWTRGDYPGVLDHGQQFVGFLGAWSNPGQLPPILSATLGALVTTWTTFLSLVFCGSSWVALALKNCAVTKRLLLLCPPLPQPLLAWF